MTKSDASTKISDLQVVVVDDNRNFLQILRWGLRACGVRNVYQAASAYQALEYLRAHDVDVVMTDLVMPGIDGAELIQLIRNDRTLGARSVPIICVSGFAERCNVEAAVRAGADGFLVKPVSAADIHRYLCRLIERPIPRVEVKGYFGPDRRRGFKGKKGEPERRHATLDI